jgi:DNA-binding LytR/AlgR family response regulator
MRALSIHIVEDQQMTIKTLQKTLEDLGYQVTGYTSTYEQTLQILQESKPDLILIDIYLSGDKTGIDLANTLNHQWKIPFVFITSHADKDTIEAAKRTKPYGYIVKPFDSKDIYATVEMAVRLAEDQPLGSIYIPLGKHKTRIAIEDFIYAHAEGNYTTFVTKSKRIVLRKGLKEVSESILHFKKFVRIHRSFLVNTDAIQSRNGHLLHMNNNETIPVGRAFAHNIE